MTTIYEAFMLAADTIERNPETYSFFSWEVPYCGGTGCMWGHVGAAFRVAVGTSNIEVAQTVCGVDTFHLYGYGRRRFGFDFSYHMPKNAAKVLRAYANEYYAPKEPSRDLIPASVREIFSHTYTAKDLTP